MEALTEKLEAFQSGKVPIVEGADGFDGPARLSVRSKGDERGYSGRFQKVVGTRGFSVGNFDFGFCPTNRTAVGQEVMGQSHDRIFVWGRHC